MPLAVATTTATELGLQPGDEAILVLQRGPSGDPTADFNGNGDLTDDACFPGEKAAEAFAAGWDAIVLVNRHFGTDDTNGVPNCGSGGYTDPMVTICTTHAAFHELFGTTPEFESADIRSQPAGDRRRQHRSGCAPRRSSTAGAT